MKKLVFCLTVGLSFLFAGNPIVDGHFEATGYSAEDQTPYVAIIAAKVDAQRQLLEQIKGIKIDSITTIENGMLNSDTVKTKIQVS